MIRRDGAELDAVGEPIDLSFSTRYAELIGELTADLLLACAELAMLRRKLVPHVAGASMGS